MKDLKTELDQLAKLKGGPKHMRLKQRQELVFEVQQEFGTEATIETFQLKETTLHNIIYCLILKVTITIN